MKAISSRKIYGCFLIKNLKSKYLFLSILFFNLSLLSAQNQTNTIDLLIEKAVNENYVENPNKAIKFGSKALQYSLDQNYTSGIAESKYEIAHSYYLLGQFKESFNLLTAIENDFPNYLKEHIPFQLKLIELKGKNLLWDGFPDKARMEFHRMLHLSKKIPDNEARYLNELKATSLLGINPEFDSAQYYIKKALSYKNYLNDSSEFILTYLNQSRYFLKENREIDSALFYNKLASHLAHKYNSKHLFLVTLQNAEIASAQKNNRTALEVAHEALALAKNKNRLLESLTAYKLLSENYGNLNDYENQSKYLVKYQNLKDSLDSNFRQNLSNYTDQFYQEEIQKGQNNHTLKIVFFSIIGILLILLSIFLIRLMKFKNLKYKEEEIRKAKEKEVELLKTKLKNDSAEDLLYIAQHRPIEFPQKFSEVYGDFVKKLLEIDPNLVASEITFCAYLKLKFSTKDIANIMYVTPKAIQNRKNRIRKKLNIPSDEDIYVWFNNL